MFLSECSVLPFNADEKIFNFLRCLMHEGMTIKQFGQNNHSLN